MTVRKAISLLANEGWVQPIKGRGVRVIWNSRETALKEDAFTVSGLKSFTESARAINAEPGSKVLRLSHVACDEETSAATGFAVGEDLTCVDRLRSLDGKPVVWSRHLFLTSEVPGITEEVAQGSLFHYIEQDLGVKISVCKRAVTVEKADQHDLDLLQVEGPLYLAVLQSMTFDSNGVQFEYIRSRYLPEIFHFFDTATRTPLP